VSTAAADDPVKAYSVAKRANQVRAQTALMLAHFRAGVPSRR